MKHVIVTYVQNEHYRNQPGLPIYTAEKKLGEGVLYVLGREQLKNYGVDSKKILDNSYYRRDYLSRADGSRYITDKVDVWEPIKVEQVYPPEEKDSEE